MTAVVALHKMPSDTKTLSVIVWCFHYRHFVAYLVVKSAKKNCPLFEPILPNGSKSDGSGNTTAEKDDDAMCFVPGMANKCESGYLFR